MNFIIIASSLIFMIIIQIAIRRNTKIEKKRDSDFWEKEREANFTRKKPLDDLEYITIPESLLIIEDNITDPNIIEDIEKLKDLSAKRIVNLTGLTNTELKLAYGAANITALSEYDDNFNSLVITLQNLAETYVAIDKKEKAVEILEYAISIGSDISKSFFLLADLYSENGNGENINLLINHAENIHSLMRETILNTLKQKENVSNQ